MAFPPPSPDELAELQKLSNEYEPEVTGPLVGQREPSTALTTEYASADPVLQAKTSALPQKYSHYRAVRGDGRCGWRAIGFGYLETLINLADGDKFLEEETRLRSLSNVINAAGFDPMLYEDFADETFDLLREVAKAVPAGDAHAVLHRAFNDDTRQNYIITHLRDEYAPWLLGQSVDQFCEQAVMPVAAEIDNISLSALKDVLLSPAGIALEVLYLDRTEGSEVNVHHFDPVNHHGVVIGTLRLLYRPGHYDILYRAEDLPQPPAAVIPTYLQYSSQTHNEPVYDLGVSDFMTAIPGMSYANSHSAWGSVSSYGSDFFATPPPVQQSTQPLPTPATPAPTSQFPAPPAQYAPPPLPNLEAPPIQMPQEMAIRPAPQSTLATPSFQQQLAGPFRPSAWELEPDLHAASQAPFQTSIFKNSHYNTAHFLNPDFQPEEWRPDDEYVTTSSKSARHKNSG